ncbi:MAG: hypothetical protein IKW90_09165 [Lachnospiraceae bacterium]|nr:hypothetical protein [Lachnospiraceae bacterium]
MSRLSPAPVFHSLPCSIVSVGCALGFSRDKTIEKAEEIGLKDDGYLTLENMNKFIRSLLSVQKKEYYKRGTRPLLEEFLRGNKKRAVVCLLGHYVYVDKENYYSFFQNERDEVVCVWWLKNESNN